MKEKCIWIYELVHQHGKRKSRETVFYRGTVDNINSKTERTVEKRYKEHLSAAKDETNTETKYQYIRNKIFEKDETFVIRTVHVYNIDDKWDKYHSEHWWVLQGVRDGHPLLNMKHGDLTDPHFLKQITDLDIKTEDDFIKNTVKHRNEANSSKKYSKTVDALYKLTNMNMKLRCDGEDLNSKINKLNNEILRLEDRKVKLDESYDEKLAEYTREMHADTKEMRGIFENLKDSVGKICGFKKMYNRSEAVEYHNNQLDILCKKYEELKDSPSLNMEKIKEYMQLVEAFEDCDIDSDFYYIYLNKADKCRKVVWKSYYAAEDYKKQAIKLKLFKVIKTGEPLPDDDILMKIRQKNALKNNV